MVINEKLCSSKQIRNYSWKRSYDYHWDMVINKLSNRLKMANPIKTWFFELIEDAIGSKAMIQFKKEEDEKKNRKSYNKPLQDNDS